MTNGRKLLVGIAGLTTVLLTSCTSRLDTPFVDDGTFINLQARNSFDIVDWNPKLSSTQRYVPVHPADGGPSQGGVSLDLDGVAGTARLGMVGMIGNKHIRFYIGGDARFNPSYDGDDDIDDFDDDGDIEFRNSNMRDIERMPLVPGTNSYGYAWMEASEYSLIPLAGMEAELGDYFIIGAEYGLPNTKFRFEKGHFRVGYTEPIERDVWDGFGQSASVKAGVRLLDNHGFFGVQYAYERYDAEFSGIGTDIEANVFSILFELRF